MKDQQNAEETVKDIVDRNHLNQLKKELKWSVHTLCSYMSCLDRSCVNDPRRKYPQSESPHEHEDHKTGVTQRLIQWRQYEEGDSVKDSHLALHILPSLPAPSNDRQSREPILPTSLSLRENRNYIRFWQQDFNTFVSKLKLFNKFFSACLNICVVQLRVRRARVAKWWMNISVKSFLFTSENWVKKRDQ